jgi:prophage regulatory protein
MNTKQHQLPSTGFLRGWQIWGCDRRNTPALIPVCRSSFLAGVKTGKYPQPIKLGERTTAWKVEDIRSLIEKLGTMS